MSSEKTKNLLLATKLFQPPLSPRRVERANLVRRLNDGLAAGHLVTLVSAPAGYGKSSLIAEWASQSRWPVSWLSLDEADDEPLRFLAYFLAALQRVDGQLGEELEWAIRARQLPPQEVIVASLVNDLFQAKSVFVCVLDDFQVIQDSLILGVLNGLVAHQPRQLHLMIATREDPALPLARLRARNQLTEVRAADLRFSEPEVEQFFREVMGLMLSDREVMLLAERTEGWIAGLQMAALSIQGRENPSEFIAALSGEHRFILEYLTEEVLKRQPPEIQRFLLYTSILSRLSGDLCDAVTGQAGNAVLLERLLAANLFIIPLDDQRRWYRYHRLFADLLQNQLRRTHPQVVKELHQRASAWHESQYFPAEAVEHALAAGDFARVMRLLELYLWALLNQGDARRVEAWMYALPAEWRDYSPRISLGFAWMHLLRGNFAQVTPYLEQAESTLARMPSASQETRAMQAECLALQSNLSQARGRLSESIEAAQRALHLNEPGNLRVAGLAYLGLGGAHRQAGDFDQAVDALQNAIRASRTSGDLVTGMLAAAHLTLMSLQYGRLRFAAATAMQAIEWLEENSDIAPPPIVGAVFGALGWVHYEWNEVETARVYFQRGIKLGEFSGHNASVIYTKVGLARLLQAEGDLDTALRAITEAVELLQSGAPAWVRPGLIVRQVSLLLATHDRAEAQMVLRQSGVSADDPLNHQNDEIYLAYVRMFLNQGQRENLKQAIALAGRIIAWAEIQQRNGITLQALILGALLHAASDDIKTSLEWLKRALALAEPEGYIRLFLDEGAPLVALLRHMPQSDYAQKLLALSLIPLQERQVLESNASLIEPLTERELEVLRLLAQGLKYAEIASRLVVSINTVRFHVKGIYSKLGVEKQAKAVEQARRLGLL